MKDQIIKNSLSGIIQLVISTIIAFIGISLFINKLGKEEYGMFSLISIIGNLSIFMKIGLDTSIVKYLSEQGKTTESNYDIVISFLIFTFLGVTLSVIFYFFKDLFFSVIGIPPALLSAANDLIVVLLVANFILLIGQVFSSLLISQQLIYIVNNLQILNSVLYWGGIIVVILLGYHISDLVIPILLSTIIWFVLIVFFSIKYWNSFDISGLSKNARRVFKKQLSYGSQVYVSGILNAFYEPLTKIIISRYLGVTSVGFYDVALRVKTQLVGAIGKVFMPLMPLLSSLTRLDQIKNIVNDLTKKLILLVLPLSVIMGFCTFPLIEVWIGESIKTISLYVFFISVSYLLFSVPMIPVYTYLLSKSKVRITILVQLLNVVSNTLIIFMFRELLGWYSVLLGSVVSLLISFIVLNYFRKKYLDWTLFNYRKENFKFFLFLIFEILLCFILNLYLDSSVIKLIVFPLLITILTLFYYRISSLITKEDINRYFANQGLLTQILLKIF